MTPDQRAAIQAAVDALHANTTFAKTIADAADIDPAETVISVRIMPHGTEAVRRSWQDVIADGEAACNALAKMLEHDT